MHLSILEIIMQLKRRWIDTNCISTSHALARELLNKPDGFLTATLGEEEYIVESYKRTLTHANIDDGIWHWTLNLRDGGRGNIKRWYLPKKRRSYCWN